MSRFTTPRRTLAIAGVLCVGGFGVAACGSDNGGSSTGSTGSAGASTSSTTSSSAKAGKVAVLLPDSKSSVRWETQDRKYLDAAFTAAGVDHTIVNAEGDPAAQRTQAEQAITNGAKVLLLVDLDPGSGSAIIANAKKSGVKVIDYDRLTLGGGADYYVSFDNASVGKLQGDGLVKCLGSASKPVVAELNGSPTDNNATLFAQGYDGVLNPLYASGTFVKGPNQSVPDWDNQKALTIFEQMLQKTSNKIDGVLAANDGLANAAISALKARKLKSIPVTGQDATAQGIQHILAGDQCMTVYKAVKAEAEAASKLAIALAKGETPNAPDSTDNKGTKTPSVLLKPIAVTKDNIKDTVIKDGFLKVSDVCTGEFAKACTAAGIS
ncbi:MAG: sugar transporter substrate-binding protein [Solirubrobacterales bacterium]|nr:sugar transporter substrate-binding protein [Solirubrobacterales bacterium]